MDQTTQHDDARELKGTTLPSWAVNLGLSVIVGLGVNSFVLGGKIQQFEQVRLDVIDLRSRQEKLTDRVTILEQAEEILKDRVREDRIEIERLQNQVLTLKYK